MSVPIPATPSSLATFTQYNLRRRLGITSFIAGTFLVLLSIAMISILGFSITSALAQHPINQHLLIGGIVTVAVLGLNLVMVGVGFLATRRKNVAVATICTTIPPATSAITFALFWAEAANNGLDAVIIAVLSTFAVSIMVSSLLSNTRTIVLTTVILMVITLGLVYLLPAAKGIEGKQFLVAAFTVINEWAFAAIGIIGSVTTRSALSDLSESQLAIEQARKLDDLKDQFISSVNHELRSPVMAMQGFVELYRSTDGKLSQDRRDHYIERASQAGKDLVALLASILDARRLDQGATDFTPEVVFVQDALEAAIRLIDPREGSTQERALKVSIPPNLAIWGETQRLRQILTNLLSNALKYSAPDTPIEFSARIITETPPPNSRHKRQVVEYQMVEICVKDYGLGIPEDQIPLLFKRFVRLQRDLASKIVGNGLGLHLCKVFAEAMGGKIWVVSSGREGEGSAFYLHLPLPPMSRSRATEISQVTPPLSQLVGSATDVGDLT